MLDRLAGKQFYCFLDGYSGYNQIAIAHEDQSKTTFTCPYGTFAFRRMPFGLCNAPTTFQRCMRAIFSDLSEHCLEIFMDDFSTFREDFDNCLSNLEKVGQEERLIATLRQHKEALGWTIADIKGISPAICMHKILLEDDHKPTVDAQRHLNQAMKDVVRKKILKWLDACIIYPISDSEWVSPIQCVPKKGGITVISNEKIELIPTRTVTGWRVCMDYRKLNKATRKDHFPSPFIDQMLDRLAGKQFSCFLDGYSGYNQIAIAPEDQSKTMFTYPYGTFAFRRMPFGLCNAPATFQRCMNVVFSDLNEDCLKIFMDDFSTFGDNFDNCLSNLEKVLKRCKEMNLVLN
ncbi:hypothetical protein GQ457_13G014940 [Hibiscus cannabinus]